MNFEKPIKDFIKKYNLNYDKKIILKASSFASRCHRKSRNDQAMPIICLDLSCQEVQAGFNQQEAVKHCTLTLKDYISQKRKVTMNLI
jgi:hypothetical protein